jgi:hypothetical protein
MSEEEKVYLVYCPKCKRKHYMTHRKCPGCGVYTTLQPVSDKVADDCHGNYICDGCEAYEDHLR